MKPLTNVERLEAVVNGEPPDRCPVHDLACIAISKIMGYQWKDLRYEPEKAAKVANEFNKLSGSDFCFGLVDNMAVFRDLGMEVSLPDDDYGSVLAPLFKKPEDVDMVEMFDPSDPKQSKWTRLGITDKIKAYRKANCTGALTGGWSWGVITTTGFLFGLENMMMYTMTEPDIVKKAARKAESVVDGVMREGLEGGDYMWLADPSASGSIMDLNAFRDFVVPYTSSVVNGWKPDFHLPVIYHVCGDSLPKMPSIPSTGIDILSADHAISMQSAREIVGQTICLMGNVDPYVQMRAGTPESIKDDSLRCIDEAGGDGRYILAPGCEVTKDTPLQNIRAMVMAGKVYRY